MTFPALNESFMHLPCVFNRLELDLSSYGSLEGSGGCILQQDVAGVGESGPQGRGLWREAENLFHL